MAVADPYSSTLAEERGVEHFHNYRVLLSHPASTRSSSSTPTSPPTAPAATGRGHRERHRRVRGRRPGLLHRPGLGRRPLGLRPRHRGRPHLSVPPGDFLRLDRRHHRPARLPAGWHTPNTRAPRTGTQRLSVRFGPKATGDSCTNQLGHFIQVTRCEAEPAVTAADAAAILAVIEAAQQAAQSGSTVKVPGPASRALSPAPACV